MQTCKTADVQLVDPKKSMWILPKAHVGLLNLQMTSLILKFSWRRLKGDAGLTLMWYLHRMNLVHFEMSDNFD